MQFLLLYLVLHICIGWSHAFVIVFQISKQAEAVSGSWRCWNLFPAVKTPAL